MHNKTIKGTYKSTKGTYKETKGTYIEHSVGEVRNDKIASLPNLAAGWVITSEILAMMAMMVILAMTIVNDY